MMHDFPLVVFTILSQLAIGIMVTMWLLEANNRKMTASTGFFISVSISAISIVAVLASLLHLGHPFEAYRAVANFGVSWLSREVTLYGIFILFSLVYCYYWKIDKPGARKKVGVLASVFGIVTIFSSAMIYTIPAIPAWNNSMTAISFFLTAALLGPIFVGGALQWKKEATFNSSVITLAALLLTAFGVMIYVSSLFSGLQEAVLTGKLMVSNAMFWIRIILWIAVMALLIPELRVKNRSITYSVLSFSLLTVSELLGRILFYTTAVHL